MSKHRNNPEKSHTKGREIRVETEPYLPGTVLVGLWEGTIEHVAFVCPINVRKEDKLFFELVENALHKAGLGGAARWK